MRKIFVNAILDDPTDWHQYGVFADWLEDQGEDTRRIRFLVTANERAKKLVVKTTDDRVYEARDTLLSAAGLDVGRLWACLCVRWMPVGNGRQVWQLLKDSRSRNAVVLSELYWCCLVAQSRVREAWEDAYDAYAAADAAAAYAAYAAYAADAAYAAYAADAAYAATREKARQWAVGLAMILPEWIREFPEVT